MRIAIVSDFYLDYVGGAQSSILEQYTALVDAGHDVFLIRSARRRKSRNIYSSVPGLEIRPAYTVPGVVLPVIGARKKLVAALGQFLNENRIDIVHLQTEFGLAHAATTAAARMGIPVIHTVHTFYWQSTGWWQALITPGLRFGLENVTQVRFPRRHFVARPSDNLLRNLTIAMAWRADTVVSPSAHQAEDLREAGVDGPIRVIPNPIARSPRAARVLSSEQVRRPRLLWVARCEPEKRPLVFAEAAIRALGLLGDAFEVDFVGHGTQLAQLRRVATPRPQIRVHGGLDHDAVIDLMDEAALVVITSVGFDNQPMTIAEASSRYRGVLYCDPNLSEGLVNSGYLATTPDARGISDAIVHLVGNRERLHDLSLGAVEDSVTFSAATYVDRIMSVYRDALARAAG